jgi:mRNA interferase MazF
VRSYTFAEPEKTRPVLIVTRNSAVQYLNAVAVAPITSTVRGVPSEVILSIDDGLATDCAANFYNLQTVPKTKVGAWITTLSQQKMAEFDSALRFALGLQT